MQRVREQLGISLELIQSLPEDGATVAVLDSGIARHPDLTGKLLAFRDFVNHRRFPYDDSGHGTHICGIICGSGVLSNGDYRGIAPAARLVVGKVLDEKGDGSTDNMLAGMRWIEEIRAQYHIRILNISVGIGNLKEACKEKALQKQLEVLWKSGVTVVCAAGNKGPGNSSISSIGVNTQVITVGCHDGEFCRDNPKRCENYSGRGDFGAIPRKPDIVAPGTDILSCNAFLNQGAYTRKSGTSMATPIVSGALALTLQKYPQMTNEELRQKLTFSARDLGEAWNKQGWGMVDVERLLA